ncbi:MAG: hypothetical protein V4725_08420 [Bacteroidota bacterium]
MQLNFFNSRSPFFDFRWFITITILVTVFMVWHDLTGGRMFTTTNQQQWSSTGPGYHK